MANDGNEQHAPNAALTVLELGESALWLHRGDAPARNSPIGAYVDAGDLRVDSELVDHDPRASNVTYLRDLDTRPLGLRGMPHASAADLAHTHMRALLTPDEAIVLVVPPSFDEATLALLLGIASRSGVHVRALVDAAAATAATVADTGPAFYLDLGVGRTLLAPLEQTATAIAATPPRALRGLGVGTARDIIERWAREQAIARWRIDPLATPTTAAALRTQCSAVRDALAHGAAAARGRLELGAEQQLEWSYESFAAALAEQSRPLRDALRGLPEDSRVLLSAAASSDALLPGVVAANCQGYRCTPQAIANAARALVASHAPRPADDGSVPHLRAWPRDLPAPPGSLVALPKRAAQPAQLLLVGAGLARPLRPGVQVALPGQAAGASPEVCQLEARSDHVLLHGQRSAGLRLNGRPIDPTLTLVVLQPGDVLRGDDGRDWSIAEWRDGL